MRGLNSWAVAVRRPAGDIYIENQLNSQHTHAKRLRKTPFFRGCFALLDSLVIGYKALEIAARESMEDEEEPRSPKKRFWQRSQEDELLDTDKISESREDYASAQEAPLRAVEDATTVPDAHDHANPSFKAEVDASWADVASLGVGLDGQACKLGGACDGSYDKHAFEPTKGSEQLSPRTSSRAEDLAMTASLCFGMLLGIALFIVVPAALSNLVIGEYDQHTLAWNAFDGIIRVVIFIFYIWLIGRMEEIKTMFCYHGAEHKTIHCFEHGLPLTPENARQFPRLHIRCGTAFLIMVMIVAIIIYTLLPINPLIESWGVPDGLPKLALVIALRILFMPIIAGVSYEVTVRWAGMNPDKPLVKFVLWPGMQMQYLTTHEPNDAQLECAIAAMEEVLKFEDRPLTRGA